jgi:hypothetical protein
MQRAMKYVPRCRAVPFLLFSPFDLPAPMESPLRGFWVGIVTCYPRAEKTNVSTLGFQPAEGLSTPSSRNPLISKGAREDILRDLGEHHEPKTFEAAT